MLRLALAAAAAALALAFPASASADAVCALQFDVRFDGAGNFSQNGAGNGICTGDVAGVALDPGTPNPNIAGVAAAGAGCALAMQKGALELRPRRAFEFWAPEHLELTGGWRATGATLRGSLLTGDTAVTISGSIGFTGSCTGAGRLSVDLLLSDERPGKAKARKRARRRT